MDKKKRYLFITNLCLSAVGVIFLSAALGTENWVVAYPVRNVGQDIEDAAKNISDDDDKFKGTVNIGLFAGQKEIDYGLGKRKYDIAVDCIVEENLCAYIIPDNAQETGARQAFINYQENIQNSNEANGSMVSPPDHGMFNYGLWVCTILFASIAIAWGVIAMGFAAFNAGTRPIETITGPLGLYIWNSLAAAFCLLSLIMYIVLYAQDLSRNVMSPDDLVNLWTSDGLARLDYSFYFIVISIVFFLVNTLLLAVFRTECNLFSSRFSTSMTEKAMDGVMMY